MHRLHFTEIQDQAWFPRFLRDAVTDTLQYAFNTAGLYMPVLPQLQKVLRISGARNVLDLCSGGGGPWLRLQRALEENHRLQVEVRLSDKYPNLSALHHLHAMTGKRLTFHNDPVDAEWSLRLCSALSDAALDVVCQHLEPMLSPTCGGFVTK